VSFEPGLVGFLRKIVRKVHINDVLLRITYIVHVKDVGVFFAVLLGLHLRQLTLADTGNSVKEHFTMIHQQLKELHQLLLHANKPAAGLWHIAVKNEIPDKRSRR